MNDIGTCDLRFQGANRLEVLRTDMIPTNVNKDEAGGVLFLRESLNNYRSAQLYTILELRNREDSIRIVAVETWEPVEHGFILKALYNLHT